MHAGPSANSPTKRSSPWTSIPPRRDHRRTHCREVAPKEGDQLTEILQIGVVPRPQRHQRFCVVRKRNLFDGQGHCGEVPVGLVGFLLTEPLGLDPQPVALSWHHPTSSHPGSRPAANDQAAGRASLLRRLQVAQKRRLRFCRAGRAKPVPPARRFSHSMPFLPLRSRGETGAQQRQRQACAVVAGRSIASWSIKPRPED